jgi:hypothetical protein
VEKSVKISKPQNWKRKKKKREREKKPLFSNLKTINNFFNENN